ncbi:maleylpyruvate isomerase N-terminal domain-containing protein [Ornithinimicrobium sufpigmenti]|uniref:maleylpyruvate isomerase N-terminal domain-containing protein n=1 Tax=Ornithinimicrobium sufpigmenti TaxID=2508882 RepID=UPI0015E1665E|nr:MULTISPECIES: maleylpyruvate isomerase N-terminal domain-containing protein [unclassified Ornithinimicrobium]
MHQRTVAEHLAGLRMAVEAMARHATEAGLDADVPTCPRWTVRKLVAHQGMVHRWARANLLGEECSPPTWNAEGRQVDGIDEMLTGFVTRGTARFARVGPLRFDVRLTDSAPAWSLEVQPDGRVVTTRVTVDTPPEEDSAVVRGPAVAAYLALWNRTAPDAMDDPAGILTDVWRRRARVRWS